MNAPAVEAVEAALLRLFLADPSGAPTSLRAEDRKKAREVAALLGELARIGRRRLVVDAAAGHAYAGLLAAELLGGIARLVVIERDARRAARAREAASRLSAAPEVDVRAGDVVDATAWPDAPDVVLALHACGAASDAVVELATVARTRWILLVPCCYARAVPFSAAAEARAEALGLPRHAEVRRPFVQSLVDAERTLRLEAAGWDVAVVPFVPRSVTGHNLLWRCRRAGEPARMREAAARLAALRAGPRAAAR